MWLIKTHDGEKERRFVAHGWIARELAEVLSQFGHPVDLFLVAEHFDPIDAKKFVLDPTTNEPLEFPDSCSLSERGYIEVHPMKRMKEKGGR